MAAAWPPEELRQVKRGSPLNAIGTGVSKLREAIRTDMMFTQIDLDENINGKRSKQNLKSSTSLLLFSASLAKREVEMVVTLATLTSYTAENPGGGGLAPLLPDPEIVYN